ncbi:unnamed protein product [Closterium sp. NIES-64]|nr:unnamed protein product [Closterium sp. NIES-64]
MLLVSGQGFTFSPFAINSPPLFSSYSQSQRPFHFDLLVVLTVSTGEDRRHTSDRVSLATCDGSGAGTAAGVGGGGATTGGVAGKETVKVTLVAVGKGSVGKSATLTCCFLPRPSAPCPVCAPVPGKETVTIVAVGKGSVGKSATLNALLGERLFPTSGFQASAHLREAVRQYGGATLHVIDTPGLVDAGTVNRAALDAILHSLVGRTVDVLLYVERLDAYRVDTIDALVAQGISNAFGPQIWKRAVVVLTRAQLSPSDGRPFGDFVAARSDALLGMIRKQGRLGRNDEVPVALVESMEGRCRTNDDGEKILPDGRAWFPCLVEALVAVALRRQPVVRVDERMARGFNPNRAGKLFIPFLLALQVVLVALPLRRAMEWDKAEEKRHRPRWEEEAEDYRRSTAAAVARRRIAAFQQQQGKANPK